MTMPEFSADASLYQTSRYYRTGVQTNKLPAQAIGAFYPAMETEEVINVHGCAPGWSDIGGSCWPDPLTESSGSGSGGGGIPGSGESGSGGGGSDGLGDYWVCKNDCETAHSKCLDTCEGTVENPKPSRNCLICDANNQRCLDRCSRNIA